MSIKRRETDFDRKCRIYGIIVWFVGAFVGILTLVGMLYLAYHLVMLLATW